LCVDVSEEGAKVIDAAEVFEVEDLFHGGWLIKSTNVAVSLYCTSQK
jgi:hypothetical protein